MRTLGRPDVHSVVSIFTLVFACASSAYETTTHASITGAAVNQSVLARGYLEQELGLTLDVVLKSPDDRKFTIRAWPGQGSIHEDDFSPFSLAPFRFRHHFYDPVYDRGLTANLGAAVPAGRRAFEWSLEAADGIVGQDFSWRDGRRYFLNALTLRDPAEREKAMAQTFRTLGQVLHLIQDMAVPEHTRNDWHAGVIPPFFPFGTPSLFEKRVQSLERALTFGAYQLPRFETLQHVWMSGDGRGLAEFTNRNFISQDTNFTQAAEGNTGQDNFGNPYPSPRLSLEQFFEFDVTTDRAPPCLAAAGLAGNVTFYGNHVDDLVTGEVIPNNFMTTYSLFDSALRSKGQPGIFAVNFCTVEAAATILLPRAVGYSTALIDYFFRGRLEPSLDSAGVAADGSTLSLQIVNRSPESLGPGILTLYADDATGTRALVPGGTLTISAAVATDTPVGQRLSLDVAAATQPMTLVYQGQLGHEAGAVIGKVYDGMLVEEIFFDGTQWQLRSPTGIFPLGLGAEVHQLKWGDRDNTLLAQTFLSGQGRRLQAYRINRPENSSRIPIVGATVDLAPWGDPALFTGVIDLGTTLVLSRTTDYAQELATVRGQFSYHFDSTLQDWVQDSAVFEPAEVETVFAEVFGGTGAYPLILAANPGPVPYRTFIDDVFLNGAGEVIALVAADNFVLPGPAPGPIFARRRDKAGALVVLEDPRLWFPFSSPDFADLGPVFNDRIWFVVNLTRGTVLAKSCDDSVTLTYATRQRRLLADLVTSGERFRVTTRSAEPTDQVIGAFSGGTFDITTAAQSGLYRSEFLTQGFAESSFHAAAFTNPLVGLQDPVPRRNVSLGAALRAEGSVRAYDKPPRQLYEVRRADGPREAYTVLGRNAGVEGDFTSNNNQWTAWQWTTSTHTLRGLAPFVGLSPVASEDLALVEANRSGAMFVEFRFDPVTFDFSVPSHVLTATQAFRFDDDITGSYRLLDAPFAYNVDDGRFHRVNATLDVLPGPRRLVAGGSPVGSYHVVGLR